MWINYKRITLYSLLAMMMSFGAVVTTGCGIQKKAENQAVVKQEDAKKTQTPDTLSIATGNTSGIFYPLGIGLAQIFTEKANIATSAQSTGSSVENIRMIKDGQADIALSLGAITDYAFKGTEMFKQGGAVDNLSVMASLYDEPVQIVVAKNSQIKTIADLKGKKVAVGVSGSGTEAVSGQLLQMSGLTFADLGGVEHLDFGEIPNSIKSGTVDAAIVIACMPTPTLSKLAEKNEMRIVGMDTNFIKKLIEKYPYYVMRDIASGTYPGVDTDTKTVAVKVQLVVRADLADSYVYTLTKALFENIDSLNTLDNKRSRQIKLETALQGISVDVHPGAAKYYQEKGVKK